MRCAQGGGAATRPRRDAARLQPRRRPAVTARDQGVELRVEKDALLAVAKRSRSIKQMRILLGRTLRDALEARQRKGGDGELVFNAALVADPKGLMA